MVRNYEIFSVKLTIQRLTKARSNKKRLTMQTLTKQNGKTFQKKGGKPK
jgi:hypothetical protein